MASDGMEVNIREFFSEMALSRGSNDKKKPDMEQSMKIIPEEDKRYEKNELRILVSQDG